MFSADFCLQQVTRPKSGRFKMCFSEIKVTNQKCLPTSLASLVVSVCSSTKLCNPLIRISKKFRAAHYAFKRNEDTCDFEAQSMDCCDFSLSSLYFFFFFCPRALMELLSLNGEVEVQKFVAHKCFMVNKKFAWYDLKKNKRIRKKIKAMFLQK